MIAKPFIVFETIKRVTQSRREYWSARELARTLEYSDYRNFEAVIKKAKEACRNSELPVKNHFVDVTEMVGIGSGAQRELQDVLLTHLTQ